LPTNNKTNLLTAKFAKETAKDAKKVSI